MNSQLSILMFLCCLLSAMNAHAACNSNMPASTPDSQLTDNGDGTITDSKTGLMWKKCLEGLSGDDCTTGTVGSFSWQKALQQPGTVNDGGGFAGHSDWRLPNINELVSIVEEQCSVPAINLSRFPNTPSGVFPNISSSVVWSGSPVADADSLYETWKVDFSHGYSGSSNRANPYAVRLVRGGQ